MLNAPLTDLTATSNIGVGNRRCKWKLHICKVTRCTVHMLPMPTFQLQYATFSCLLVVLMPTPTTLVLSPEDLEF
jgi:hypothetical protein